MRACGGGCQCTMPCARETAPGAAAMRRLVFTMMGASVAAMR